MSINSLQRKIKKEIFKKKKFLKYELKRLTMKSVMQNCHLPLIKRQGVWIKYNVNTKFYYTLSKQHGICLTSGKLNTSRKKFPFSRQFIKKYTDMGLLQNIKSISW